MSSSDVLFSVLGNGDEYITELVMYRIAIEVRFDNFIREV